MHAFIDFVHFGIEFDERFGDIELGDQILGKSDALRAAGEDQSRRVAMDDDLEIAGLASERLRNALRNVIGRRRGLTGGARNGSLECHHLGDRRATAAAIWPRAGPSIGSNIELCDCIGDNADELTTTVDYSAVNNPAVNTLTYDADHRLLTGSTDGFSLETAVCAPPGTGIGFGGEKRQSNQIFDAYIWGPDGRIDQETFNKGALAAQFTRSLHYSDSGALLFSDDAGSLDSIKIGAYATIGKFTSGQQTLDIDDRELSGILVSDHTAAGTNAWTLPNDVLQPCSPQQTLPGASAGYAVIADYKKEPYPDLIDDGLNVMAGRDLMSAMTLSSSATTGGQFSSGISSLGRIRVLESKAPEPKHIGDDPSNPSPFPTYLDPYDPYIGFLNAPLSPRLPNRFPGTGPGGTYKHIGHTSVHYPKPAVPLPIPIFGSIWIYAATSQDENGNITACYWGVTCDLPARIRAHLKVGRDVRESWPIDEFDKTSQGFNVESYMMKASDTLQPGQPGFNPIPSISEQNESYDPVGAAALAERLGLDPGFFEDIEPLP